MAEKKNRKTKKLAVDKSIEGRRIDWINKLLGPPPANRLSLGIGDDAAVWKPRRGYRAVLTRRQPERRHPLPAGLAQPGGNRQTGRKLQHQ